MRRDTLYVTDLDGTLLNDASRIPPKSVALLTRLVKAGAMFTVATARTPATVQRLMSAIPTSRIYHPATGMRYNIPAIVMTGAALWDRNRQYFPSVTLIPEKDAIEISNAFSRSGLRPFTYSLSGNSFLNVYHSRAMTPREEAFFNERRRLSMKRFHLDQQPSTMDRVVLFFATGPEQVVEAVCEQLKEVTNCSVSWYRDIFSHGTGLIDIYAPGVSKADAVRRMARDIGARRVVVFGDNLNDLPMMQVADVAVAVENALPEVKNRADIVIGPNIENSVARFILNDA